MVNAFEVVRLIEASKRELEFLREYEAARTQLFASQLKASNDAAKLIGELRLEVQSIIRDAQKRAKVGTDFTFQQRSLRAITKDLDQSFKQTGKALGRDLRGRLEETVKIGAQLTGNAFRRVNVPMPFPKTSPELLRQIASQGAPFLTEASARTSEAVARQIRLGATGLKNAGDVRNSISSILQTSHVPRAGGVRRRIGFPYQAESIYRTEMGRAFSSAQHEATTEINRRVKGMKKRWRTTGRSNVRTGHKMVERSSTQRPILLDQRFLVVDYTRTGSSGPLGKDGQSEFFTRKDQAGLQFVYRTKKQRRRGKIIRDRMLFPRDPGASAGNVLNCACTVIDVVPDFDKTIDRLIKEFEEGG